MRLTVGICTWNRSSLLRQGLERMTHLIIPAGVEWELLIVNNNCTDDTDSAIASFASRLPIRRLFQPQPGKSHALNLAVTEASGEYILWTDDDTLMDQDWLAAYFRAFQQWPSTVFFGGPIQPWFAVPPPKWLKQAFPHYGSAWHLRDFGEHPILLNSADRFPYGPNWAIRANEQRRYPYDPRFGPRAGRHPGGEETLLMRSLLADGYHGRWVPDARVLHYVPPEHMTTWRLRKIFFGYGRFLALTNPPARVAMLFGRPRWAWRHAVTAEGRYWWHRMFSNPERWVGDLIAASTAWGNLLSSDTSTERSSARQSALR